ncbi:chloride channel [Dipodascopsis uninucleata]
MGKKTKGLSLPLISRTSTSRSDSEASEELLGPQTAPPFPLPAVRFDLHSPGIRPRSIHAPVNRDTLSIVDVFSQQGIPPERATASSENASIWSATSTGTGNIATAASSNGDVRRREMTPSKRLWYDDWTTIDWVHDFIKESFRVKILRDMPGLRGRFYRARDAVQGWVLILGIGAVVACIAYLIDLAEQRVFDWRLGYCAGGNWYMSKRVCCADKETCSAWIQWKLAFGGSDFAEYAAYIVISIALATVAVLLTLTTASSTPFPRTAAAKSAFPPGSDSADLSSATGPPILTESPAVPSPPYATPRSVIYTAAGGGVAEVKTILSGFVIKRFLGSYTLLVKSVALVFSISSGLNLGKEGPYVHIASCVGNIACRLFPKFNHNDGKRREILSAAASAGVAVAFGSPLGGVLFSLEEVSYYFPPKTLIRSFLCAVISALVLKLLNPYGTGKIVIFEVSYDHDWHAFEFLIFVFIGACGGVMGALFGRLNLWWTATFRRLSIISKHPVLDVVIMAAVTASVSYFNVHTKKAPSELLYDLARTCSYQTLMPIGDEWDELCPTSPSMYASSIKSLMYAFVVKFFLTSFTVGLKVPAGIYVPSMVNGALFGRMVGLCVQWLQFKAPNLFLFSSCPAGSDPLACTIPGVYAIVGAGAVMAGVTRMTVTLAVILFELTGSLDHVLPISVAILVSKYVAQALQPSSLYDIIMHSNNFPFLDNQKTPGFSSTLHDIVTHDDVSSPSTIIDITDSPYISVVSLRKMLRILQESGEFDGSIPIIRNNVICGLLPAPELEYALDKIKETDAINNGVQYTDLADLQDNSEVLCHISVDEREVQRYYHGMVTNMNSVEAHATDLTPFVDRTPICLDIKSPVSMAYLVFVKLGLRIICLVEDGKFYGVLHKKRFIEFCHVGEHNVETWF